MTIDDRLAFGEYVSIPIRTEKTAEQKWIELRKILIERYAELMEGYFKALELGDDDVANELLSERHGVVFALSEMDRLDELDT